VRRVLINCFSLSLRDNAGGGGVQGSGAGQFSWDSPKGSKMEEK
jgi:hypothetical protein